MKKTALFEEHVKLGAKMVPFAGYEMPLTYTKLNEEHQAVRNGVGLFDVSHMGCFIIRGVQAEDWVDYLTSNDVRKLEIGQAQYSCLPNDEGGIVDDLIVYRLTEEHCSAGERSYMLVVNAANIEKDWNWIQEHKGAFEADSINISDRTSLIAIQGPDATSLLQQFTDMPLEDISFYHFRKGQVAGFENVLVSATGYTGSGGFELYLENEHTAQVWQKLIEAGGKPCGLGARDTLRMEMGYCLYGNDITDDTNPLEAGLGWITKLKSKGDFVGRGPIEAMKANGIGRRLVALELDSRRVPRQGYSILSESGEEIGKVTSGTLSPSLQKPIALGYVHRDFMAKGTPVKVDLGKKTIDAMVSRAPFLKV